MVKKLPGNWQWVKIQDITEKSQYGYTTKAVDDGQVHFVRTTDITKGKINWDTVPYCKEDPEDLEKYQLEIGDILISRAGSVGESYLINSLPDCPAVFASYLIRFKPTINTKYFKYFLNSPEYWNAITENQSGIAVPNVNATKLNAISFPLSPEVTQNHIVEKIEELFSELDNGVENLKKAQQQLKTYRQAVLKDAFVGKLTKEWREQQDDLPTPEELLQQIKAEHKAHRLYELAEWEKEVEQWEKDGKPARKPRKPRKQKNLDPIKQKELDKLSELPSEWIWIKFEVFKDSPQNGLYKPKSDYGSGHEIVRIDNFYDGRMTGKLKKVCLSEDEISKYRIKTNNLLFNRVNSLPYLGKCGLVTDKYSDSVFESNVMKVELNEQIALPKLLAYYLSSQTGTTQIRKNAKHAVNQAGINQTDVANTLIPLTSVQEQSQTLNEIETRISVVDQLEQTINENLQKAEALRQSILKKAFGG